MGDQGIMFYSTDPADDGNVLTAAGATIYRAGTPRTLPAAGEYDDSGMLTRTLVLAAIGLGLLGAGVRVGRRPR